MAQTYKLSDIPIHYINFLIDLSPTYTCQRLEPRLDAKCPIYTAYSILILEGIEQIQICTRTLLQFE